MSANSQLGYPDDLVEVWQDVVSIRHLLWSGAIGVVLGLGGYVGGRFFLHVLDPTLNQQLANGYALFFGVGGCVLALTISCVLFKPKRVLTVTVVESQQILEALEEEGITVAEELAALKALPADVRRELDEVQVYDQMIRILEASQSS